MSNNGESKEASKWIDRIKFRVSWLLLLYFTLPPFFFLRPSLSPPPTFSFSTFLYSIDSSVTRHARDPVHMESLLGIRKLRYTYVIIQSFLIYLIYADLSRTIVKSKIIWNDQSEDFATSNDNGSFLYWILHKRISLYISYVYNTFCRLIPVFFKPFVRI